jgi:flagellar capping protein FliD
MQELEVFGTDERKARAILLDSKLEDSLLESYTYMAEIIDGRLYKELGYNNARSYFQAKEISVGQAYTYALIGRTYAPYLGEEYNRKKIASLGTSKIAEIARKCEDQIPALVGNNVIKLGDEEYTLEDINSMSVRDFNERMKKLSKKVEKNELLEEQNKTLSLEKKTLEKELTEFKRRDEKYREYSTEFDQIEEDIRGAYAALEVMMKKITRIQSEHAPEDLQLRMVSLIDSLQRAGNRAANMHAEILILHMHSDDDMDALDNL